MLCSNVCSCGIYSNSLIVSGSGGQGDPWQIETIFGGVYTSSTRPAGPITGLTIYETDTKRQVTYDGTNWVIMAGQMPGCVAYTAGGSQVLTSGVNSDLSLVSELYDIGGFHSGTNAFLTVPAGMAGDYTVTTRMRCAASAAVGQRTVTTSIGSNGSQTVVANSASTFPQENTNNTGVISSGTIRLVAGAVVTAQGYQSALVNATVPEVSLALDMIRHIPSLT